MITSLHFITSFARRKGANSRVATQSVYRPEDRRQNVDTVLYSKGKHNRGVSQDPFLSHKDLHAGLYRASDRRHELAKNCVTPYGRLMQETPAQPVGVVVEDTTTTPACLADMNMNTNREGNASASSSVALLTPAQPNATHVDTAFQNNPPRMHTRVQQTVQDGLPSVAVAPPMQNSVGVLQLLTQETPGLLTQETPSVEMPMQNPYRVLQLLTQETPSNRQLEQEKAEEFKTEKADTTVLRDSPPQSEPVLEASRLQGTRVRRRPQNQVEKPRYIRCLLQVQPDDHVNVQLVNVLQSRQDILIKGLALFNDSDDPLPPRGPIRLPLPLQNTRRPNTLQVESAQQLTLSENATSSKQLTPSATATSSKRKRREAKAAKAVEAAKATKAAKAAAKAAANNAHCISVNPSPLSNRGGFSAPFSNPLNAAFLILPVALFLVMLFSKKQPNRRRVIG